MKGIKVKNLSKSYGKLQVLDNISFDIDMGSIVALVGPNGSGKTTLLNIISNLLNEDNGSVLITGQSNKDFNVYNTLSYMTDSSALYDELSAMDHLKYICNIRKLPKLRLLEAGNVLGIGSFLDKKVKGYSMGMKQQLLFTMGIISKPKVYILDEPFNALDPSMVIKVRSELTRMAQEGTCVLLSSHNLSEIDLLTNDIMFLKDGKILREDISKYFETMYCFKVSDVDKVKEEVLGYDFQIMDNEIWYPAGADLSEFIPKLAAVTNILDIRKENHGAEERYKEIYFDEV